jgi:outer membrane protein TolC
LLLATILLVAGCKPQQPFYFHEKEGLSHYVGESQKIEYPDVDTCRLDDVARAKPPLTLDNTRPEQIWELPLEEAVKISMSNSTVIRNTGGVAFGPTGVQGTPSSLTQAPGTAATTYLPALSESDPRQGPEAALAGYDAQFSTSVFWEKNDTPRNVAGIVELFTPPVFMQDLGTFQTQIAQENATGGQVAIRQNVRYEWNNSTSSRAWPSEWDTNVEAEIRQPLLRGAGVQFNRIAGVDGQIGYNNGIMIARLRVDQSLCDLEAAVRGLSLQVEQSYWNLYYAYRRLDSAIAGRNAALETWRMVYSRYSIGARGGSAQEEAEARGQYNDFVASVQDAQTNLYKNERVLRYLMGLAPTDGRLICPSSDPTKARVDFDYYESQAEALVRSVELRRQKWRIKQAELEMIASKNYLLPQLDGVARYRWLGIGDILLDPGRATDPVTGRERDAFGSMTSGAYQEWHLGMDLRFPFGFRREMAGVRYAQLVLTRERKILQEQELEVIAQLQDALSDMVFNYNQAQARYDQRAAAQKEVRAAEAEYRAGTKTLDIVLQAQQRFANADAQFHRALVDYNLAITQVHFRKGSLLEYNSVYLAEGPWPAKAYFDARRRARHRDAALYVDYGFTRPAVVSRGPVAQFTEPLPAPEGEAVGGKAEVIDVPRLPLVPQADPQGSPTGTAPEGQPSKPAPQAKPSGVLDIPAPQPEESSREMPRRIPGPVQGAAQGPSLSGTSGPKKGYDLGSLDLRGLSANAKKARPAAQVRPAGYQQESQPAERASGGDSWKPVERTRNHEPVANPSAAATDSPAPGWQAVQH